MAIVKTRTMQFSKMRLTKVTNLLSNYSPAMCIILLIGEYDPIMDAVIHACMHAHRHKNVLQNKSEQS